MAVSEAFFAKPKKPEEILPPKGRILTLPQEAASERISGDLREVFVAAEDEERASFRAANDPDILPSVSEADMDAFIAAQKALEEAMSKDVNISLEPERLVAESDIETPEQAELRTRGSEARIGGKKMPLTDENWKAAQRALGVSTGTAETPLDVTDSSFDLNKGLAVTETEREGAQVLSDKELDQAEKLLHGQEAQYIQLKTDIMGLQMALDGEMSEEERAAQTKKLAEYSKRADHIDAFLTKARAALQKRSV